MFLESFIDLCCNEFCQVDADVLKGTSLLILF